MTNTVGTSTPANTPQPIGPYNYLAKVGQCISIGGTTGVNPASGQWAGPHIYSQAEQILQSVRVMLQYEKLSTYDTIAAGFLSEVLLGELP